MHDDIVTRWIIPFILCWIMVMLNVVFIYSAINQNPLFWFFVPPLLALLVVCILMLVKGE
jgi:hypothetical protein